VGKYAESTIEDILEVRKFMDGIIAGVISESPNIRNQVINLDRRYIGSIFDDMVEAVHNSEYYSELFTYVNTINPRVLGEAIDAMEAKRKLKESMK
jgi:hypothetical protein